MGTLTKPTTVIVQRSAGAWSAPISQLGVSNHVSAPGCQHVSLRVSGAWEYRYSTPTITGTAAGGNAASGASPNGTASVSLSASTGGDNSGSLAVSWAYFDGDAGCTITSGGNTLTPTISRPFTGVGNGSTSGAVSARFQPTVTDNLTGAIYVGDPVSTGNLSWTNTIPSFTAHTDTIRSGTNGYSGTEVVPAGAVSLTIKRVGGGGAGGVANFNIGRGDNDGGQGGGSGALTTLTIALSGDAGKSISWTLGAGGTSEWPTIGGTTTTTGTLTNGSVSGSAVGGAGGASGGNFAAGAGFGGSPGGNNGIDGGEESGGAGGAGPLGDGYGQGGNGGPDGGGDPGIDGELLFIWS